MMRTCNYQDSFCKIIVSVVLLLLCFPGTMGIRIQKVDVPPRVRAGQSVSLTCHYDLEGKNLYSLNWWRGGDQFYQFSPNNHQKVVVYDSPGITVDLNASSGNLVVLRNVSHASAGKYKCEVLADYPSFEKDSSFTNMEVVEAPEHPPTVVIRRYQWSLGEALEANCTSPGGRPPPQLYWFINGKKIPSQHSRLVTPKPTNLGIGWDSDTGGMSAGGSSEGAAAMGSRTSTLNLVLRAAHFSPSGQATLSCSATLPGLYDRRSTNVVFTLPGFRAAAPSQKLYGSAYSSRGQSLMLVASIMSLVIIAL